MSQYKPKHVADIINVKECVHRLFSVFSGILINCDTIHGKCKILRVPNDVRLLATG